MAAKNAKVAKGMRFVGATPCGCPSDAMLPGSMRKSDLTTKKITKEVRMIKTPNFVLFVSFVVVDFG